MSDLHLGARGASDVLRRPEALAPLLQALDGCERLVLLGDLVELRHAPLREAFAAAREPLSEIGRALGASREVVIVPGNHDHRLLGGWLERRAAEASPPALGLESSVDWRHGEPLAEIARWLEPAAVRVAYPGVWLAEGVYATHGHHGDRHTTVPIMERLGAGLMARIVPEPDHGLARAEDYEDTLGPMYAWIDAIAQSGRLRGPGGGSLQVRAWRSLQRSGGSRGLRRRTAALAFPAVVFALNRAGFGPLGADVSGRELRRASLRGFEEALRRLEVDARHVVFGHTHRAGPLPGDARGEWETAAGAALLNTGCWVYARSFLGPDPDRSPYRPGFAAVLEDSAAPRLVNLLDDLEVDWGSGSERARRRDARAR